MSHLREEFVVPSSWSWVGEWLSEWVSFLTAHQHIIVYSVPYNRWQVDLKQRIFIVKVYSRQSQILLISHYSSVMEETVGISLASYSSSSGIRKSAAAARCLATDIHCIIMSVTRQFNIYGPIISNFSDTTQVEADRDQFLTYFPLCRNVVASIKKDQQHDCDTKSSLIITTCN